MSNILSSHLNIDKCLMRSSSSHILGCIFRNGYCWRARFPNFLTKHLFQNHIWTIVMWFLLLFILVKSTFMESSRLPDLHFKGCVKIVIKMSCSCTVSFSGCFQYIESIKINKSTCFSLFDRLDVKTPIANWIDIWDVVNFNCDLFWSQGEMATSKLKHWNWREKTMFIMNNIDF